MMELILTRQTRHAEAAMSRVNIFLKNISDSQPNLSRDISIIPQYMIKCMVLYKVYGAIMLHRNDNFKCRI